jgi:hypothetical protein
MISDALLHYIPIFSPVFVECADVVQRDARQLLGLRGWRSKAANRDEWRRLMREPKAQKGL